MFDMILDDFLIAIIIAGFALAGVYLKAEYALHVQSKAAERKKIVLSDLHVAPGSLEHNGMLVQVRIVHAPLQRYLTAFGCQGVVVASPVPAIERVSAPSIGSSREGVGDGSRCAVGAGHTR
jgi:hypothetical protein